MVNGVGFVITEEENLALGPEMRLQALRDFLWQKFYYSEKGIGKSSDTDIRKGQSAPPASFIKALYTFSIQFSSVQSLSRV